MVARGRAVIRDKVSEALCRGGGAGVVFVGGGVGIIRRVRGDDLKHERARIRRFGNFCHHRSKVDVGIEGETMLVRIGVVIMRVQGNHPVTEKLQKGDFTFCEARVMSCVKAEFRLGVVVHKEREYAEKSLVFYREGDTLFFRVRKESIKAGKA